MSNSGKLLRMNKKQTKTITFTQAQLEQHDIQVARETIERRQAELKHFIDKRAEEVQKQYFNPENKLIEEKIICYVLAVSCKVLIEQFGWTPIKRRVDGRMRIVRLVDGIKAELKEVVKYGGFKPYSDYVKDRYGVEWKDYESEGE